MSSLLRVLLIVVVVVAITIENYLGLLNSFYETATNSTDHLRSNKRSKTSAESRNDPKIESSIELRSSLDNDRLLSIIKGDCLPKLICELNALPNKERITATEQNLLNIIRETSINAMAQVTSKYHFAAHMGQLISGVVGNGCHNFYPLCPFPAQQVLQILRRVNLKSP